MGAILYCYALVCSKRPVGMELAFTQGYGKNSANLSRICPKFGPVRKRTVPFLYEQKRYVYFRSTFRTCWVSVGTHKCNSFTKLVTLSQYIRDTLFYCQCFLIFRKKLLNFNFSEPQNSFSEITLPIFFLYFWLV